MKKILTITLLCLPFVVMPQIPNPQPNTYVNDLAHVLTNDNIAKINKRIHDIEIKYSIQIAVIFIDNLPDGYQIEDFAREIGRKWHVGNARNGLVYVAAINNRKQRLEVSANLEGVMPDITAKRITDNIKPYFKNKDYAGGILSMVNEIDGIVNPEAQEQRKLAEAEQKKKSDNAFSVFVNILEFLFGFAVISLIIVWFIRRKKKGKEKLEPKKYKSNEIYNYISPTVSSESNNNYYGDYYSSRSYQGNSDSYRSSSSSSDSGSSSSDYGDWGSGSSDSSSSSDSGFSGGGSSNDW